MDIKSNLFWRTICIIKFYFENCPSPKKHQNCPVRDFHIKITVSLLKFSLELIDLLERLSKINPVRAIFGKIVL